MKKFILNSLITIIATSSIAQEALPIFDEQLDTLQTQIESEFSKTHFEPLPIPVEEIKHFKYFGIGGCGFAIPFMPEAMIGMRKVNSHHAWDINLGGASLLTSHPIWVFYGQTSYLYFPQKSSGFYLGAGITAGVCKTEGIFSGSRKMGPYVNLPITTGHQYANGKNYRFIQFQITPLLTTSISYGFGF